MDTSAPPDADRLRFQHGTVVLDHPREWEPARLILPTRCTAVWDKLTVRVQGRDVPVRLERCGPEHRACAEWERAGPGQWKVTFEGPGIAGCSIVQVESVKLDAIAMERMVEDVEQRLPASIAIGLDQLKAFAGLDWKPPVHATLAQDIAELRKAIKGDEAGPGLVRILQDVTRAPHQILRREEPWVRVETARRPVHSRLAMALARPGNLLRPGLPARVIDGRVSTTLDVYENRLVRAFLDQVDRRLRTVELVAQHLKAMEKHRVVLFELRKAMLAGGDAVASLGPLAPLQGRGLPLTQVLMRRPAYRAAWDGFRRFRQSARLHLRHPALDAPMQDIPTLYELWNTLRIVDGLLNVAADAGWQLVSQNLYSVDTAGPWLRPVPSGSLMQLRHGDTVATLQSQPKYTPQLEPLRSISNLQQPDLTLEIAAPCCGTKI